MGQNQTIKSKQQVPELTPTFLKRSSTASFHNLHSPRNNNIHHKQNNSLNKNNHSIHKQYIWKKWKFRDQQKTQQLLSKLKYKMDNSQNCIISVLDIQYVKMSIAMGNEQWKVRAKIEFSERNLRTQVEKRRMQYLGYSCGEIWAVCGQLLNIADYCNKKHIQLSDNLSNYLIFPSSSCSSNTIKLKDPQLLPNIKCYSSSKVPCPQRNLNTALSRIITNLCLLLTVSQQNVSIVQINRINLKYNCNLATFVYCVGQENLGIGEIRGLLERLRSGGDIGVGVGDAYSKINNFDFCSNKVINNNDKYLLSQMIQLPKTQEKAKNIQHPFPLPQNILQQKAQQKSLTKYPCSSSSTQQLSKNLKRIQQIKPKHINKLRMINSNFFVREKQFEGNQNENKENLAYSKNCGKSCKSLGRSIGVDANTNININIQKSVKTSKIVTKSLEISQPQDHHFPKRTKQFIRTSSTDTEITSSRIFQMKTSQARNQAFIKMTNGSKCELFSQDQNQELLQSIIQSEQSIIIKNNQSPLMILETDMDLFGGDFFKNQNNQQHDRQYQILQKLEQQRQEKSLVQFGYQRNSTIMEVTQENQDSAQQSLAKQISHSRIKSLVKNSQSHISQFQLENLKQDLNQDQKSNINLNQDLNSKQHQSQTEKQIQKFVIQQYEGGSKYEGYIVNGLRNGFGKLYYQDGGSYQGSWKNGEIEGYGKLFYQSGDLAYQGYWSRGQFHGQGKIINQNPDQIQGMFNYENFSDVGIAWIWYQGSFQNDHKNGRGTLMLSNGQQFTGNWVKNNVHGQGIFSTLENQRIRGIWQNNVLVQIKQKLEDQVINFLS